MNFDRTVLANGLRLILIPMESVKSVTALVMVGAGSRWESRQNNGISHFLEHMAFKGTKKRPSAILISSLIDGIGGEFNAFTSKETTGYYIKSSANHIKLILDVLSDMLKNSLFDVREINKERGVILEEINLYEDTPVRKIGDIYEQLLYGDTPMGWDVAGQKEIIKKIDRQNFLSYMGSLYSPHNMTVVVAGGFKPSAVTELVQKYFGQMPRFDTKSAEKVVEKQKKPQVFIKQKKTEQAHLALGVRTFPVHDKRRYTLSVLATILGGGMSSRLFHEVREKRGLAYYVRSSNEAYDDCGSLVTTSGVDPKRIDEAITVILEEYYKIANSQFRIHNSELTKAKEYMKGHLILELEDSRAVAGFYGSQEILERKIETPDEAIAKIKAVTVEELEAVAKEIFRMERLNLAIIGQFDSGQRFQSLLKL